MGHNDGAPGIVKSPIGGNGVVPRGRLGRGPEEIRNEAGSQKAEAGDDEDEGPGGVLGGGSHHGIETLEQWINVERETEREEVVLQRKSRS